MTKKTDINEYIEALKSSRKFGAQIVCHKIIRENQASFQKPRTALNSRLLRALGKLHAANLYSHQAEAVDLIRQGKDVVVATPTASGKSLIYNIPVLEKHFSEAPSHALYLFPLKALAQDQQKILANFFSALEDEGASVTNDFCSVYDGDTKEVDPILRPPRLVF